MTKLCFIDCETTGLDPDQHQIWEIGMIVRGRVLGGEIDDIEYVWQLPVDLGRADPMALNIGRFHERRTGRLGSSLATIDDGFIIDMADEGGRPLVPRFWARDFVDLTRDAHLVGAVVSFDADRLWRLLRRLGECPMWHYHLIDIEALAAGHCRGVAEVGREEGVPVGSAVNRRLMEVSAPPWDSDELSDAIGVVRSEDEKHTALGDARWARDMYDAVMGKP